MSKKICMVEGCENEVLGRGYCEKHYTQIRRHGKLLERTRHDPNEIIYKKNYAVICLYNMKQEKVAETIIDKEDAERVSKYKWCLMNTGDVITALGNKRLKLHRLLINAPNESEVDHIDRNRLNNRKNNLRICKHSENLRNLSKRKDNTSGFTGVIWCKRNKRWKAQICLHGKCVYLGSFMSIDDAIACRLKAEKKYFQEYAPRR